MATGTSRQRLRPARSDPPRRPGLALAAAIAAASVVVIGVGLITDGPRVSDDFDGIEAAIAAPGTGTLDRDAPSTVFGSVASGDGQTVGAAGAPGVLGTSLNAQGDRCTTAFAEAEFIAIPILSHLWTGGLAIRYPARACDSASRLKIAGLRSSQGAHAGSQESPTGSQGSSQRGDQGGSQGGSQGAGNPVGDTISTPVSGAGGTGSTVGNTVKKPVSAAGGTVGNTVNNVGNTVKNPVSGVGGIIKGLGE